MIPNTPAPPHTWDNTSTLFFFLFFFFRRGENPLPYISRGIVYLDLRWNSEILTLNILKHLAGKTGYGTICARFPEDIKFKMLGILQAKNPTKHRFQKGMLRETAQSNNLPVISLQFHLAQLFRKLTAIWRFLLFFLLNYFSQDAISALFSCRDVLPSLL